MYIKGNIFIEPDYPMYFGIGNSRFNERVKSIVEEWVEELRGLASLAKTTTISVSVQNIKQPKDKYGNINLNVPTLDQIKQPDWNQNDIKAVDYIKNKPTVSYKNEVLIFN